MARPREFDIDSALDAAMAAFWERGYEATSLQDLLDAMDLTKGSLYKAFGDKHSLFIKALKKYLDFIYNTMFDATKSGETAYQSIENLMHGVEYFCCKQETSRGCFAVNSVVELSHHDPEVKQLLENHLNRVEKMLTGIIKDGQDNNEFRTDQSASHLAEGLFVVIMGMLAQSKATNNKAKARRISDFAIQSMVAR